ncbi:MAG: hypothetical protein RR598_08400 [Anaerorhabdus sp.]
MTKLEKLNNELKRTQSEIEKMKAKEIEIKDKINLEEEKLIRKMMTDHHISVDDLLNLVNKEKNLN